MLVFFKKQMHTCNSCSCKDIRDASNLSHKLSCERFLTKLRKLFFEYVDKNTSDELELAVPVGSFYRLFTYLSLSSVPKELLVQKCSFVSRACRIFESWQTLLICINKLARNFWKITPMSKSSHRKVFCKKVFLKISQNSRENTWAGVYFLMKLQVIGIDVFLRVLRNV